MTRTEELDDIMRRHNLTARQAGDLIGRKAHTVRNWRCQSEDRIIPAQSLELLKLKLAARS